MRIERHRAASAGWAALCGYVFAWDLLGCLFKFELLTEGWRRWLNHPKARWVVGISWALTTKHLFFGRFLPWLDPFHIIGLVFRVIEKISGRTQPKELKALLN